MEAKTIMAIQKQKASPLNHLRVTTCLYRNPSESARSLSTLIAVNVSKDTEVRMVKRTAAIAVEYAQIYLSGGEIVFLASRNRQRWLVLK